MSSSFALRLSFSSYASSTHSTHHWCIGEPFIFQHFVQFSFAQPMRTRNCVLLDFHLVARAFYDDFCLQPAAQHKRDARPEALPAYPVIAFLSFTGYDKCAANSMYATLNSQAVLST